MSQGSLHYPIQQFLRCLVPLVPPFESSRTEFVQKLRYHDLEAGRLHLDSWLDRGEGYEGFLKRVSVWHPEHADDLERALADTAEIKSAEGDSGWRERCANEGASFVNFVHVEGERTVPGGITTFGLSGGHARWTTIHIPAAILRLALEEQLAALPELMRAYLREYKGACPFVGMVRSFIYVRLRDYYRFDKDCRFVEHVRSDSSEGTWKFLSGEQADVISGIRAQHTWRSSASLLHLSSNDFDWYF
jgi:hypothetical protein